MRRWQSDLVDGADVKREVTVLAAIANQFLSGIELTFAQRACIF
jgi:hypothetical protein